MGHGAVDGYHCRCPFSCSWMVGGLLGTVAPQGSPERSCRRLRAATSTHWSSCWITGVTCPAFPAGGREQSPAVTPAALMLRAVTVRGVPRGHPWALQFALPDDLWTGVSFQVWMDRSELLFLAMLVPAFCPVFSEVVYRFLSDLCSLSVLFTPPWLAFSLHS